MAKSKYNAAIRRQEAEVVAVFSIDSVVFFVEAKHGDLFKC